MHLRATGGEKLGVPKVRGGQFLEPLDGCGFHVGGMGAAAPGTEHGAGVGQEGTAGWSRAVSGGGSGQALGIFGTRGIPSLDPRWGGR